MAYSGERGTSDGHGCPAGGDATASSEDSPAPPGVPADDRWNAVLAAAIDAGQFGFVLLGEDARICGANGPACALLGHGRSELVGRGLTEFVHPDDRGWSTSQIELLLGGVTRHLRQELRLLAEGDADVWIELNVRPVRDLGDASVYAVAMLEDASDRRARESELRRLADTDPLTELFNRRRFAAELGRHLARAERYGTRGSLLFVDVDRLKSINDRAGHLAGDNAIITTATLLRTHLRASDVVARIGGDEFAVLLPDAGPVQAATVAQALLRGAAAESGPGALVRITLSIGITPVAPDGIDMATLFERADAALYDVKRSGGNGYRTRDATGRPVGDGDRSLAEGSPPERFPTDALAPPPGPATPAPQIDLETLLATVAELRGASVDLVAWELFTEEEAVQEAWAAAVRDGLIERSRYDAEDREWLYDLTAAGRARLGKEGGGGEDPEEKPPRRPRPPAGP
jgi:diguanylate cyclase (GGDEF)-like protein/PAS domain S-box-containing protein